MQTMAAVMESMTGGGGGGAVQGKPGLWSPEMSKTPLAALSVAAEAIRAIWKTSGVPSKRICTCFQFLELS